VGVSNFRKKKIPAQQKLLKKNLPSRSVFNLKNVLAQAIAKQTNKQTKNHAQPKGEKKIHAPKIPPHPPKKLWSVPNRQ